MEVIFTDVVGTVLFVRDDMESGAWTQEEFAVNATYPFVDGKVIARGQRMMFRDPATGAMEVFEIRNVVNTEPEHYQQITAEHIALAELADEHIDETEISDDTPAHALQTALTGTLWAVGNSGVSDLSSCDISRGSVWQAVGVIESNWNVYIKPRITFNAAGAITGRYLDIAPAQGTWRGVRLSISKNMSDASVTYDDTDVHTALYGYGGSVDVSGDDDEDDTTETLTFASVTWTATEDHPAKPYGQTYIEDPAKTAIYGRNGRPRFGFYQNGDIEDADVLIHKTWESLKETSNPKINITGTVTDLYRLGYTDEPLQLHDTVIVEVEETGEMFEKEVIKLEIDLIDPTANRPEIGDYIPNIIYINRDTDDAATGSSSGGGGGSGQSNEDYEDSETWSGFEKTNAMIAMVVGTRNGTNYIKAGEIGLAINKSGESGQYESTAYINADHVNISATQTAYSLAGEMERDANGNLIIKSAGGMYVRKTTSGVTAEFGVWDQGNLTGGVMVTQINGQSTLKLSADVIDIAGVVTALEAYNISVGTLTCGAISCQGIDNNGNGLDTGGITVGSTGMYSEGSIYSEGDIDCEGDMTASSIAVTTLTVNGDDATWQSQSIHGFTLSNQHRFTYDDNGTESYVTGYIITADTTTTIYYLGK